MAEILAVLYFRVMNIDQADPAWDGRDRLILSKAHGSPGLRATLALRGFYPIEGICTYTELDGLLEGHLDMTRTPGLESSGGPLGMGLSVAAGRALDHAARPTHRRHRPHRQGQGRGDGRVQPYVAHARA